MAGPTTRKSEVFSLNGSEVLGRKGLCGLTSFTHLQTRRHSIARVFISRTKAVNSSYHRVQVPPVHRELTLLPHTRGVADCLAGFVQQLPLANA